MRRIRPPCRTRSEREATSSIWRLATNRELHRAPASALLAAVCVCTVSGAAQGNRAIPPALAFASSWAENDGGAELYSVDVATRRPLRLTTTVSQSELTPAISPDGARMAYAIVGPSLVAETTDVLVADASGRHGKTIARVPSYPNVKGIAWSPDGRSIAFVADGLYLAAADGGNLKRLADASEIATAGPSWSPDGARLAFEGPGGVTVIARDGSGELVLASGGSAPSWSPDGKAIAFVDPSSAAGGGGIELVAPDGASPPRPVVTGAVSAPTWSPDSGSLAFVRGTFDDARVSVVRSDGSGEHAVAKARSVAPAWAPDGRSLAYVLERPEPGHGDLVTLTTGELHVVEASGTGDRVLVAVRLQRIATPVWAPGGRSVVYSAVLPANDPEIYLTAGAGQKPRPLTHNLLDDVQPSWSPDHRLIAFVRATWEVDWEDQPASPSIYVMRSDGTALHRIAAGENPAWSPDGTSIAFDDGTNVSVVSAHGGRPRIVAKDPAWRSRDPTWSPDGKRIAFVRADRIMTVSAHGVRARYLTKPPHWDRSPAWSPDGLSIAIDRTGDICLVTVSNGNVRCLTHEGGPRHVGTFGSPAWSPDSSTIVCTRWARHSILELLRLDGTTRVLLNEPGNAFDPAW